MSKKKVLNLLMMCIGVLTLTLIIGIWIYMNWEKAPDIEELAKPVIKNEPETEAAAAEDQGIAFNTERADGVYTILLVGNDQGNGNTDTMMVGKIDTVNHTMDFVSIPRDTLVNTAWEVRKLNSAYWRSEAGNGEGIEALRAQVKNLIGFDVDCYAVIDIDVFVKTVDALGGIYFDVPVNMSYSDPSQNLYIDIPAGYQLLSGEDAIKVCRFRAGYANGDLGRIDVQHDFLKAAASQMISLGNIPNISKVVDILSDGLYTNLSAANIAYFLRQALMCDSGSINFHTAPNYSTMVHGYSYVLLSLNEWLEMVNSKLNPYTTPVTAENLDLVYSTGYDYAGTRGIVDPGYFYYVPETTPVPEPSPVPSTEPVIPETGDEPEATHQPEWEEPTEPTPEPEGNDGSADWESLING